MLWKINFAADAEYVHHLLEEKQFLCPTFCYQSVYYCLILNFLARIRTTKCFMNSSSKLFRCEVVYENGHTFGSWTHHFLATAVNTGLATRVTLTRVWRGKLGESVTQGWTAADSFLCCSMLLSLGCVFNGALCINLPRTHLKKSKIVHTALFFST
jgi:hypothetical protein